MTVSNEPGYYEDGQYGIRIESIVLVKEATTPNNFGQKGYLGFEHVTVYAPFAFPSFTPCSCYVLVVDAPSRPNWLTFRF
jgi:Xaa-Pro aminopeptidase